MPDVPEGAALPSPIHPAVAGVPVEQRMPEVLWVWESDGPKWTAEAEAHLRDSESGQVKYLRADLALPRPWRTAEDLEALPVGSVVLVGTWQRFVTARRRAHGWYVQHNTPNTTTERLVDIDKGESGLILYIPPTEAP